MRFIFSRLFSIFALIALVPAATRADETLPPLLIHATRIPTEASRLGSAATIIDAEEIERRGAATVAEVLRAVPGLDVSALGSVGGLTQIRLRGTNDNHLLVLIDGIRANDHAQDGAIDLSMLPVDDIERIEILRGPQSGLWGSGAVGGVINIITRGPEAGTRLRSAVEGGSAPSGRASIGATIGGELAGLDLSASAFRSTGNNIARTGSEPDGASRYAARARGFVDLGTGSRLDIVAQASRKRAETDPEFLPFDGLPDDGYAVSELEEAAARAQLTTTLLGGALTTVAGLEAKASRFEYRDGTGTFPAEGNHYRASWRGDLALPSPSEAVAHAFTVFLDHERDETTAPFTAGGATVGITDTGLGAEYRLFAFDRLSLTLGARHDWNDPFDDATTFRATASLQVPETGSRLHASIGSGVKNPSFFDIYGFANLSAPNPDLKPERSLGWDVGLEQTLFDGRFVGDVTVFDMRLSDLIFYDFTRDSAVNLPGTSRIIGVEASATFEATDALSFTGSYTWQAAGDADGRWLPRRPHHKARIAAAWRFLDNRVGAGIGITYTGARIDVSNGNRTRLDEAFLLDAQLSYAVSPSARIWLRGENLLDERHEEAHGYRLPGLTIYAGFSTTFGAQ